MNDVKKELWTEEMVLTLPLGEHDFFDRKSGRLFNDSNFRGDVAKALSAFANTGGGHLVLGVQDDGTIDGVPARKGRTPTREWLEQIIPHLLSYPLQDFRVHEVVPASPSAIPSGHVVIVVDIGDSMLAPHQTADTKNYYHRSGGHSLRAPHIYLEALRSRQRFPSQPVVRAWLDTVINPLLGIFKQARECLAEKAWDWNGRKERITPLHLINRDDRPYIIPIADPHNKEQFFDSHVDIAKAVDEYDDAVIELGKKCGLLYEAVKDSEALSKTYQEVISSESFLKTRPVIYAQGDEVPKDADSLLRTLFGSRATEESRLASLAQNIVNKLGELDNSHSTSRFWNTFREQFIAVLDDPTLSQVNNGVDEAERALSQSIENLISLFQQTRRHLAMQHGVPFTVPSPQKTDW
jgi:hypothetical protein